MYIRNINIYGANRIFTFRHDFYNFVITNGSFREWGASKVKAEKYPQYLNRIIPAQGNLKRFMRASFN